MGDWKWFWGGGGGEGSSGFGSNSTAEEVTRGIQAAHLTAVVTGGTNGIGKETVRVLALRGANVILPCRSLDSGRMVKESLLKENPDAKIDVMEMDLSSLDSIESFAHAFHSSYEHLNILINNAGIMACPFQLSKDGVELQFATNHLGHFFLTNLLLEKLATTAQETGIQGRIINVSSIGHSRKSDDSWFHLDKLNDQSKYVPFGAYSKSKLANIWHASELAQRLQDAGSNMTANSLHPGAIPTNISRHINIKPFLLGIIATVAKPFLKTIPQGASTTCYLALHPNVKDVTGKYFVNCNETVPSVAAIDGDLSRKFWCFSEELLKSLRKS